MKAIVYLKNNTSVSIEFYGCDVLQANGLNDINSYEIVPVVTAEEAEYINGTQKYNFKIKLIGIENIKQRITWNYFCNLVSARSHKGYHDEVACR